MDSKKLIQVAWVWETAIVIGATLIFVWFPMVMPLWVTALPLLTTLIGAQGAAASIGPAIVKKAQIDNGGQGCGKN